MKKIQNYYLYSYRLVGFVFLTGLILSILWYGFSMLFFIGNRTWSVPMILSPNQEKVMAHLEHVIVFEHEVAKNKAELRAAEQVLHHKKTLLKNHQQLLERVNQSMLYQSLQYSKESIKFKNLSEERANNIRQLRELNAGISNEEKAIEQELKLGLITKQEALLAHVAWNKLASNLLDSKTHMHDLEQRAKDYADAAKTLNGSGNHLTSMNKVIKKVELEGQLAELNSDIFSLQISTQQLKKNIDKKKHVLQFMKNSPYILATKKETTVAFVPYVNLHTVTIGAPVFSCYLDMIFCYKSGYISGVYNAEEYSKHPIFKSDVKGQFIAIHFNSATDGQKKLLFINSKPLFI